MIPTTISSRDASSCVTPSPVARRVSNDDEQPPEPNRFVLVNLQKTHTQAAWGLGIAWISNSLFFRQATSQNTVVRGYWETLSHVRPDEMGRDCGKAAQLLQCPPLRSAPATSVTPITGVLETGDFILCMGGHAISEFRDLSHVANYLRLYSELQIVVFRPAKQDRLLVPTYHPLPKPVSKRPLFVTPPPPKPIYKNPLFKDPQTGQPGIRYCDEDEIDPEDGHRLHHFVRPITDFSSWLIQRKKAWGRYVDDSERVKIDFWAPRYPSHAEWLAARTTSWKAQYSWNKEKKETIVKSFEKVVNIELDFEDWLETRKHQWKVMRRKRHRDEPAAAFTMANPELLVIDELLQEQEARKKSRKDRPPIDITFIFDSSLGCPDDAVANIFSYLQPHEHPKMLALNSNLRQKLITRERLFQLLCPSHWKLPRRPRKPWYLIYLTKLKIETERSRKQWDDLLARASSMLLGGDCVLAIEKLVTEAELNCRFNVNYVSSVVCERNSLLNLAVIHARFKIVRWLVETKSADIESYDRGGFTALLNAAYNGNKAMVRFLLQKGADRSKIGRFHYTKPVSAQAFQGLDAEGWASRKGYADVAKLIRLGL